MYANGMLLLTQWERLLGLNYDINTSNNCKHRQRIQTISSKGNYASLEQVGGVYKIFGWKEKRSLHTERVKTPSGAVDGKGSLAVKH